MTNALEPTNSPGRLWSLDAYRGAIMLLMVSAGLGIPTVAKSFPTCTVMQELRYQTDHVLWDGCGLWDLIQPSFMFMVGVAMPFSHASRIAKGQSFRRIALHVIWRSIFLCFLGIFLISNSSRITDWSFVNVLTQIGLGYAFVYMLIGRGMITQLCAAVGVMLIHWLIFDRYTPSETFDYAQYGFTSEKMFEPYQGLFAHWNPINNAGAAIDTLWLGLFPRIKPNDDLINHNGYVTINFISSMATMIFGLMAGEWLRRPETNPQRKLAGLVIAAGLCLALGWGMGHTICPSVKKIWTPSWAVFSAGWAFAFLAGFYGLIDLLGWKRWTWPLRAVGMNSIAVYCISMTLRPWVRETLKRHLGAGIFQGTYFGIKIFPSIWEPMAITVVFTVFVWLVAVWLERRKIFIRI